MNENLYLSEKIIKGIKQNFPHLSYEGVSKMLTLFEIQNVKKKEEIIKTGQYNGKIIFVLSGLFRAYYKSKNTEHTFWFRDEFTVFASHRSILQGKPSTISYQALEDSIVAILDYESVKRMALTSPDISQNMIAVLESLILELIDRVEEFITLNPEERYKIFMEKHPTVTNRVPQQQLASLIGITPVSFSRLKSRMMNK
jgi:CRP-like cAMP-binding protein